MGGYFSGSLPVIKLSQKNATCVENFLQKSFLFASFACFVQVSINIFAYFLDYNLNKRELFAVFSEHPLLLSLDV